jgi:HSP20 family protein
MKATLQKEPRTNNMQTQQQQPPQPTEYLAPEVDIFETQDGYVLQAEMPGVNKEGLEITLEGNEITLVGHRNGVAIKGQPLFRESQRADYRRVFELDPAIDTSRISAKIDQGLLTLTLPKSEKVKPRKISVD